MAAASPFFTKIDRTADGGILFPPNGFDRAVGHRDDLGGMNDLDAAIVAAMLLQFGLDLRGVADEEKFVDLRILAQRQDRAADEIRRPEIATHGVQSDFHRVGNLRFSVGECKTKKSECGSGLGAARRAGPDHSGSEDRGTDASPRLGRLAGVDRQDLPALVIPAGRASRVRSDGAAALRAFIELRRLPAMRSLARAQPHLRGFAFWDSHKSGSGKQEIAQKTTGFRFEGSDCTGRAPLKPEPYFNFSLSSAPQSGGRASSTAFASSFLINSGTGQIRPPSRSQCG